MVVAVVEFLNHIYRKYSEVFLFTKNFLEFDVVQSEGFPPKVNNIPVNDTCHFIYTTGERHVNDDVVTIKGIRVLILFVINSIFRPIEES